MAACAVYLKSHSYGEYVFDWAWADAYQRHGLHYYPKLLCAVPFTPVPGAGCWRATPHRAAAAARDAADLQARELSRRICCSWTLPIRAAAAEGWMLRQTVQFHWHNRSRRGYAGFDEFLGQPDARQAQGDRAGAAPRGRGGRHLRRARARRSTPRVGLLLRCYTRTYAAHHSTPYLNREFFHRMRTRWREHCLMFLAQREGRRIACRCWPSTLIAAKPTAGTGAAPNTSLPAFRGLLLPAD